MVRFESVIQEGRKGPLLPIVRLEVAMVNKLTRWLSNHPETELLLHYPKIAAYDIDYMKYVYDPTPQSLNTGRNCGH